MFGRGWEGGTGTIVSCQIGGSAKLDRSVTREAAKAYKESSREQFVDVAAEGFGAGGSAMLDTPEQVGVAWDRAGKTARERMEEYQRAKAAGDGAAAGKARAEGKRYNEEQVRLGEELKRLQGS